MLVASLTQRPEPIADPRAFLRREFADWGFDLRDNGALDTTGFLAGGWEWLTIEETRERFAGSPWLDVHSACPWVGPTLGYVLVEYLYGDPEDWTDVLWPLIKEGRGVVASTVTGEFHTAVTRQRRPLYHVLGKYGLDDGAMLLERDWGPYQEGVAVELRRAVTAAGWVGHPPFGWMSTCHNSWRWNDPHLGSGAEREVIERLGDVEVDLWLYDFDCESLVVVPD